MQQIPLTVSVFLVHTGIRFYRSGTYWPHVIKLLNLPRGSLNVWRNRLGELFLSGVKRYNLLTFKSSVDCFVTPITAHAGVVNSEIDEYFDFLFNRFKTSLPFLTLGYLKRCTAAWRRDGVLAGKNLMPKPLSTLSRPLHTFIIHGGPSSDNFLYHSLSALNMLTEEGEITHSQLPKRVKQRLRKWWAEKRQRTAKGTNGLPKGYIFSPRICLDPGAGEIQLEFPGGFISRKAFSQFDAARAEFVVENSSGAKLAEEPIKMYAQAQRINLERKSLPIAPEDNYRLLLKLGNKTLKSWAQQGISPKHPYIFFNTNRQALDSEKKVPQKGWLVFNPSYCQMPKAAVGRRLNLYSKWDGYLCCRYNLPKGDKLEIEGEGKNTYIHAAQEIEPKVSFELKEGSKPFRCTADHGQVYSVLPKVYLPLRVENNKRLWGAEFIDECENKMAFYPLDELDLTHLSSYLTFDLAQLIKEPGKYTLRFFKRYGSAKPFELDLLYLPNFNVNFDTGLYLPQHKTAELELTFSSGVSLNEPAAAENSKCSLQINPLTDVIPIVLNFYKKNNFKAHVKIKLPLISYKLSGENRWFNTVHTYQSQDLFSISYRHLEVKVPEDIKGRAVLAAGGNKQEASIKNGRADFQLIPFKETVINSDASPTVFTLSIPKRDIDPFTILKVQK